MPRLHRFCDCRNAVYSATNLTVGLSNTHPLAVKPAIGGYVLCGQHPGIVDAGARFRVECAGDLSWARYVIVQVPSSGDAISLGLCEVEVYITQGQQTFFKQRLYNVNLDSFTVARLSLIHI